MRHKNSVLHGLLQHLPWGTFDRLVEEHGGDKGMRTLSMRTQFTALAYGQLSGASSLREIEGALQSHEARLYHLNARPIKRSTLADANASRPVAVFAGLFAKLLGQAHRGLRRALAETVYLINSTSLRLNGLSVDWASFSAGVCGAKAHVVLDADAGVPVYMAVTAAKVERYHRREGDAHRSRRDLCFRPRLLRLRLVGEARRSGLPDRDAAEVEYTA